MRILYFATINIVEKLFLTLKLNLGRNPHVAYLPSFGSNNQRHHNMKQTTLTTAIMILLSSTIFGQLKKDLNIDFMLRGHLYVKSSIIDSSALGGFGSSKNLPKKINDSLNLNSNGLLLKIDTTQKTLINDIYNGYKFYIANNTDTIVKLRASDSRLSVIAEVFYKGKWKPIEYLPSSWCGNSYHNVYLKQNEYWEFDIPKFTGKIKVKLRYKLIMGIDKYLYSNEILTSINKGQLENKEGHKSNGIMDPYND